MTLLRDMIDVQHRVVRAISLDEDLHDPDVLRGYSPGAHVIDGLRRIAVSLQPGARTRAWSITGPYGAGKSSFAHLLCSLLASKSDPAYRAAVTILSTADTQLADTLDRERRRLGVEQRGVIPAAVTAAREPIAQALLRALSRGAEHYWSGPGRRPDVLRRLREASASGKASSELVFPLLNDLVAFAPVLIIVDELGKNLEFAADRPVEGDLYVLQQLAERFSSSPTFSGGVLTLAHLAFEDYLVSADDLRRREWRKIHGRFEDIPFVANTAHSIRLLGEALTLTANAKQRKVISNAALAAEEGVQEVSQHLSLPSATTGAAETTYPLHPTVALALPALASRLAQHDRSLVAFLTSDAPHALPAFLSRHEFEGPNVPFIRLADLYEYFFEEGAATVLAGAEGERTREIKARVDEALELDELERCVLKTVGLLNVVEGPERQVASAALVEQAVVGPGGGADERRQVQAALERLVERSLLTHRDFAGEYCVWQGSDFDTRGEIRAARERLTVSGTSDEQILQIVAEANRLRPAVARRHSLQYQLLRYFECRYTDQKPQSEVDAAAEDADGLVLYVLANRNAPKVLPAETTDGRPLVVVWSPYGGEVRELALDFAAARAVLSGAPELERDAVARRELRHRVAALQAALINRIDEAFSYERPNVMWFWGGKRCRARGPAEFSRLLSDLCDRRYPRTPVIRNEMINRRELTSQGSKARRMLVERIFTHEHEPRLGIDGYGPERAMYEAVLNHTGLHQNRGERWGVSGPPTGSDLSDVWSHLMGLLDDAFERPVGVDELYRELRDPPFGMKVGAIPVLLAVGLQYRADDVFLYQDGSFQPVVEAVHIERLLKSPERFAVKRASLVGVRASVFEELRQLLAHDPPESGRRVRNETTLSVVRPLIAFAAALPAYTRGTRSISEVAQRVCQALLNAREPDELLFTVMPPACGLDGFSADPKSQDDSQPAEYVERLRLALGELGSCYQLLLDRIGSLLHAGFAVAGSQHALREDLRTRSRRLLQQVIEPKMRSFLMTAADENLDDGDWLEALAMTLASKPPPAWSDHDVTVFEALVAERAQWFRRLEVLYHQMHGPQGVGFDARRVTLTAPDGTETAELVTVDPGTREIVGDVLDTALAQLEARLGANQAHRALLGVLAHRLLCPDDAQAEAAPPSERKANEA